jgi:hypothetical protein
MLKEAFELKALQLSHSLQASKSALRLVQLMVFANNLALVVFPTPLGPQNKNA